MGLILMSERELKRAEVLGEVKAGRLTPGAAADILDLSRRQVFRLLKGFRSDGVVAVRHKARGRPPNNRISDIRQEYALAVIRESYADFGPTLVAEMLAEHHGLKVSRETVRSWMRDAGLWLERRQRRTLHRLRRRREGLGELVQIDGSEHRWFEARGEPCTLLVFIDDATGRLMELRFVPSETAFNYFAALESYLLAHGRPVAFYSDKHSVFRVTRQDAQHGAGITQFGRALSELNIDIICANSSQAKGRVERANRTLQDRLVKALRLAEVSDITAGNTFLPGFMATFNARFARMPLRPDDLHRPLNTPPEQLRDILCWRERRHVTQDLVLSYDRKRVMLVDSDLARRAAGQDIDTYVFPDGRFEVRWQGHALPYTMFDKDQRVSQSVIVENKRLSEALAWIKAEQDARPPKPEPKILTNSERVAYRKTGRKPRGRPPAVVIQPASA